MKFLKITIFLYLVLQQQANIFGKKSQKDRKILQLLSNSDYFNCLLQNKFQKDLIQVCLENLQNQQNQLLNYHDQMKQILSQILHQDKFCLNRVISNYDKCYSDIKDQLIVAFPTLSQNVDGQIFSNIQNVLHKFFNQQEQKVQQEMSLQIHYYQDDQQLPSDYETIDAKRVDVSNVTNQNSNVLNAQQSNGSSLVNGGQVKRVQTVNNQGFVSKSTTQNDQSFKKFHFKDGQQINADGSNVQNVNVDKSTELNNSTINTPNTTVNTNNDTNTPNTTNTSDTTNTTDTKNNTNTTDSTNISNTTNSNTTNTPIQPTNVPNRNNTTNTPNVNNTTNTPNTIENTNSQNTNPNTNSTSDSKQQTNQNVVENNLNIDSQPIQIPKQDNSSIQRAIITNNQTISKKQFNQNDIQSNGNINQQQKTDNIPNINVQQEIVVDKNNQTNTINSQEYTPITNTTVTNDNNSTNITNTNDTNSTIPTNTTNNTNPTIPTNTTNNTNQTNIINTNNTNPTNTISTNNTTQQTTSSNTDQNITSNKNQQLLNLIKNQQSQLNGVIQDNMKQLYNLQSKLKEIEYQKNQIFQLEQIDSKIEQDLEVAFKLQQGSQNQILSSDKDQKQTEILQSLKQDQNLLNQIQQKNIIKFVNNPIHSAKTLHDDLSKSPMVKIQHNPRHLKRTIKKRLKKNKKKLRNLIQKLDILSQQEKLQKFDFDNNLKIAIQKQNYINKIENLKNKIQERNLRLSKKSKKIKNYQNSSLYLLNMSSSRKLCYQDLINKLRKIESNISIDQKTKKELLYKIIKIKQILDSKKNQNLQSQYENEEKFFLQILAKINSQKDKFNEIMGNIEKDETQNLSKMQQLHLNEQYKQILEENHQLEHQLYAQMKNLLENQRKIEQQKAQLQKRIQLQIQIIRSKHKQLEKDQIVRLGIVRRASLSLLLSSLFLVLIQLYINYCNFHQKFSVGMYSKLFQKGFSKSYQKMSYTQLHSTLTSQSYKGFSLEIIRIILVYSPIINPQTKQIVFLMIQWFKNPKHYSSDFLKVLKQSILDIIIISAYKSSILSAFLYTKHFDYSSQMAIKDKLLIIYNK